MEIMQLDNSNITITLKSAMYNLLIKVLQFRLHSIVDTLPVNSDLMISGLCTSRKPYYMFLAAAQ